MSSDNACKKVTDESFVHLSQRFKPSRCGRIRDLVEPVVIRFGADPADLIRINEGMVRVKSCMNDSLEWLEFITEELILKVTALGTIIEQSKPVKAVKPAVPKDVYHPVHRLKYYG